MALGLWGRRRLTQAVRAGELLEDRRMMAIAPLLDDFPGIEQTFDQSFFFDSQITPPDPTAAVGPGVNGVIVAAVNSSIAIYRKDGTPLDEVGLTESNLGGGTFFGAVDDDSTTSFDPWVIYDHYSDRFVVLALQQNEFSFESRMLVAVSTTSAPNDLDTDFGDLDNDWHVYSLASTINFGGTPAWADYAKLAVDGDDLFISSNYFEFGTNDFAAAVILRLDKQPLIDGPAGFIDPAEVDVIVANGGSTLIPVERTDAGPSDQQWFIESTFNLQTGQGGGLAIWSLDDNNVLTSRQIAAPFGFAADVPQPQSEGLLDALGDRVLNSVYRAGSIWTAHTVADPDDGEATVRWYEIVPAGGTFQIKQSGDIDPGPSIYTFMPSINVNYRGDMAITYTQVSTSTTTRPQFASMMYSTRLAADTPGFTEPGAVIHAGTGAYELFRWGDYAALPIDPDDFETFYAYHQTAVDEFNWETWFGVFRYAEQVSSGGFGRVVAQSPDGVATLPPQWLGLEFNQAMLTTSFELEDVLSMTGPGNVALPVSQYILGFEWVNSYALRIFLRPLDVDGEYRITIAPTIFTEQTGSPLDEDGDGQGGEPGDDNYVATFQLDLAEIIGIKYHDRNGNGRQDSGEEPLSNWQIYLDTNENGRFDRQTEVFQTASGEPIPQPSPTPVALLSTMEVTDLPSQIEDVNVRLNISHSFDEDLTVELTSPSGAKVVLFSNIGGSGDNFLSTVLDDQASADIGSGTAPFTGVFRPEESLSRLIGLEPNGDWTLTVTDNSPGDVGVLIDWALEITATEPSRFTDATGGYSFRGLSGGSYRVAEVQQDGWVQTEPAQPGLKITELDLNFPDFIEIQNLTEEPIDTSGWFVAVSGEPFGADGINNVNPVVWRLGDSIDAGEIQFRSDSPSNYYWGSNIFWNEANDRFGSGWAMIVDDAGRIVDWVGWGYTSDQLAAFNVQIDIGTGAPVNVTNAQLQAAWQGDALFLTPPNVPSTIKRVGDGDANRSSDFEFSAFASINGTNAGLSSPLADIGNQTRNVLLEPGEEILQVNFGNRFVGSGNPPAPSNVTPLGLVDWTRQTDVNLTSQPKWYSFTAERDGVLTLLAAPDNSASSAYMSLYTAGMAPLTTAQGAGASSGRINWNVRAGDSFLVSATGAGSADLTWANLVSSSGNRIDVAGSDVDDVYSVQFDGTSLGLNVNGLAYSFSLVGVTSVNLAGGAGRNTLTLGDSAGDDTFEARPSGVVFTTSSLALQAGGFQQVAATATRGGIDRAFLYDTTGDDTLTVNGGAAELVSAALKYSATGFDRLRAYGSGGFDRAFLNDTSGDETVTIKPDVVQQQGATFDNYAHGFDRVRSYGGRGFDRAFVYDSTGDDTLTAEPAVVQITGANYDNYAHGFDRVRAFASGGFDRAFLYDSTGSDDLYLYADRTEFKGANYDNIVYGFDRLRAFAGQGFDRAFLYDSAASDDVYLYPTRTELKGANYDNIVYDFERVRAFASAGFDRAYFYDTAGDDTLNVRGTSTQLTGAAYDNYADQFDVVRVFASTGVDRLTIHDTDGDDAVTASPAEVRVRGVGFDVTARGFDAGNFLAGRGNDSADLLDSAGDDLVEARSAQALFTNAQFAWTLSGFKRVRASATSGGADRLRMSAIDYLFEEVGDWEHI